MDKPINLYKPPLMPEEQKSIMANTSPVMIWIAGPDRMLYFFSEGWLKFTGRTPEQESGTGWLASVHPDDISQCLDVYNQAFEHLVEFKREYRLRRHDGAYCRILDHAMPRYTVHGEFAGYIGSCINVEDSTNGTEKISKESASATLAKTIEELKRSNEDLEQFAYVASHDIKEPLRKILVYNDFVLANKEDTEKYAAKIKEAALRMDKMIDNLLNLSRVNRKATYSDRIDLNKILTDVKGDLEVSIGEKNATIKSETLPAIRGNHEQINQLFFNLLSNALKYSKVHVDPYVVIRSQPVEADKVPFAQLDPASKYIEITVTDNGIGFEQDQAENIFTLFHRLHSQERFPGAGLGLALCKKVADNHGGHIYATSASNAGAVFHVILPAYDQTTIG